MRLQLLFPRPASALFALFVLFSFSSLAAPRPPLWGRVRVVSSHPQFRVRVVSSHPDIYILRTARPPESVGQWQFVEAFEDFTVQFVEAFEDFTIQYVEAFPGIRSPSSRLSRFLASASVRSSQFTLHSSQLTAHSSQFTVIALAGR